MRRAPAQARSPTAALLLGLIITLATVVAYSWYISRQISGLRQLQTELTDRNRRDSLQLLRIQNDLNQLGLAMRDMLDADQRYPLTAWSAQFGRIRGDLEEALQREEDVAVARRTSEQTRYLAEAMTQFWEAVDRMFAVANAGQEPAARDQVRVSLQARQAALSAAVARLLVQNNEQEQQAAEQIGGIYRGIERNAYLFLAASVLLIGTLSWVLIRENRANFQKLAELSDQRRELAQQLISTQESAFRAISRDLHDEFGQILTALGSMLQRAGRFAPGDEFKQQLQETSEIVQETLERVRGLSQSLQPVILDELGLQGAIPWHLSTFERQTGIHVHYEQSAPFHQFEPSRAIHIFRILQESLNNVARHAQVNEVFVRSGSSDDRTTLEVEDRGVGIPDTRRNGIGLAGMRERAEILNASISISRRSEGGTLLRLVVPHA